MPVADDSVASPAAHGIRYLLVPLDPTLDELQRVWPTLYAEGAGFASLVREWEDASGIGATAWRLYRVN